jgi:hypothetical protein
MWQNLKKETKWFLTNTWEDFKYVWKAYPNVHIWWTIAFLIALFV